LNEYQQQHQQQQNPGSLQVNLGSLQVNPVSSRSTQVAGTRSVENTLHPQGDHLSGKLGNVREFDSCQRHVRDFTKIREMSGKNLVREKWPKTVHC